MIHSEPYCGSFHIIVETTQRVAPEVVTSRMGFDSVNETLHQLKMGEPGMKSSTRLRRVRAAKYNWMFTSSTAGRWRGFHFGSHQRLPHPRAVTQGHQNTIPLSLMQSNATRRKPKRCQEMDLSHSVLALLSLQCCYITCHGQLSYSVNYPALRHYSTYRSPFRYSPAAYTAVGNYVAKAEYRWNGQTRIAAQEVSSFKLRELCFSCEWIQTSGVPLRVNRWGSEAVNWHLSISTEHNRSSYAF